MMKAKIVALLLLVLLAFTAISCSQEVIFYDIAHEVKLVNPEINGNITSLVPLGGKLYVQNGDIYEKAVPSVAHGWKRIAKPAGSGNIVRIASDDAYLYAMDVVIGSDDNPAFSVWARSSTGTTWTKIADNVKTLFDNQVSATDLTTAGRVAYITDGDGVKQLSGTAAPSLISAPDVFQRTGNNDYIKAAAYTGTATVFSSNAAICVSGSNLYSIDYDAKTVKYSTDGGASWAEGGKVDDYAKCICAYGTDKLLVGTANGYQICTIDGSGVPSKGANAPEETNAESLIGNKRQVIMIKSFGNSIYAGIVSDTRSDYSKLWGWFGASWNYE